MGKRSKFKRVERDFYPTPIEAVKPLIPHLIGNYTYWEPCAGDGSMVEHIQTITHPGRWPCILASDICPAVIQVVGVSKQDALTCDMPKCDYIISNPPWSVHLLHPMIERFSSHAPTWLLFYADWMHTKQSAPFMPWCRKIVSVGRVKWIPDSKMTGKDNAAWYLFDQSKGGPTEFVGRTGPTD